MTAFAKVSGEYVVTAPHGKVSGTWEPAVEGWVKTNGVWEHFYLQSGLLDNDFDNTLGSGANNDVNGVALQPDGKIVIAGRFTTFNGTATGSISSIARLNSDGTLDTAFTSNTGTGPSAAIDAAIAIQPDGKIVVGGDASTFNGTTVGVSGSVYRLNSDGSLDTAFTTAGGTGVNADVTCLALQSDGKILVGGDFSLFNGTTVGVSGSIIRLNSDGSLDTAFTTAGGTGVNNDVDAIAIQQDGKIIIGGDFTTFNGTTASGITRLNSDGTLDTDFATNAGTGADGGIEAVAIQPDGKIVAIGNFIAYNGTTTSATGESSVIRLNSDGTLDTAFTTNTGTGGDGKLDNECLIVQPDGKILAGGPINSFNGVAVDGLFMLESDGTLDTGFLSRVGSNLNDEPRQAVIRPNGNIVVVGAFTSFNGLTTGGVIQIGSGPVF